MDRREALISTPAAEAQKKRAGFGLKSVRIDAGGAGRKAPSQPTQAATIGRFGGRRRLTVSPVAWLANVRSAPNCLASDRITRMPSPPSLFASKS